MNLQLPADIDTAVQAFLVSGQYKNEAEVLRDALAVLRRRDEDWVAIQEGLADEAAGRLTPARTVLEQTKQRLDRDST